MQVRLTEDARGVPGIHAEDPVSALFGLGAVHGRDRPLQSKLLGHLGRGRLAERVAPAPALVRMDALAHRLRLPDRGDQVAAQLSPWARTRVDAYLAGLAWGLARADQMAAERWLLKDLPVPTVADLAAGFALSAYLGLAEGQERMERVLVEALTEGADPALLERMFHPHLEGWAQDELRALPPRRPGPGFAAHGLVAAGGSNAWAVTGARTASGAALLAGDPHLPVQQLPALFCEVRARVGREDYWLGASLPGLPGIAVGRNRRLAWSGTFSVPDNVDFFIEDVDGDRVQGPRGSEPIFDRDVEIRRRGLPPLRLRFGDTARGTLEARPARGPTLAAAWPGASGLAEAMEAYLRLLEADSVAAADEILDHAHTLSLHFVTADRGGAVRRRQLGRVPDRTPGWSGLYPVRPAQADWRRVRTPADLPRDDGGPGGWVATANEDRVDAEGRALGTFSQPRYRLDRIEALLAARPAHDVASFQRMQLDLRSGQADRLAPMLQAALHEVAPGAPVTRALQGWDHACGVDSTGAHAFALAYRAALSALAPDLGGAWFEGLLERSEVSVWWCAALDRALADPATWTPARRRRLGERLRGVAGVSPRPWGDVQRLEQAHLLFGGLPDVLGLDRGPFPLPGSIATVCQGKRVPLGADHVVVAPAYRFVTDLATDEAWSSLPGGPSGHPGRAGYDAHLSGYLAGAYSPLRPPAADEATVAIASDSSTPIRSARGI